MVHPVRSSRRMAALLAPLVVLSLHAALAALFHTKAGPGEPEVQRTGKTDMGLAGDAPDEAPRRKPRRRPPTPATWRLAFVRDGDIWTAKGDGSDQRRAIRNGGSPCWSPDRTQIAFSRDGNIWVANADGTGERQLTFRWKTDPYPEIRGDGIDVTWDSLNDSILYSHRDEFRVMQVASGETDTESLSCLFAVSPRSPDEDDKIPYHREKVPSDEGHPACSRSGKRLAFTRNGDIWLTVLLDKLGDEAWAPWNSFTKRIASVADHYTQDYGADYYVCGPTRLAWSPDEGTLAYSFERLNGWGISEIRLLPLARVDSEEETIHVARQIKLVEDAAQPCFSPDGKSIIFTDRDVRGSQGLACVSLSGKNRRILIRDGSQPAW